MATRRQATKRPPIRRIKAPKPRAARPRVTAPKRRAQLRDEPRFVGKYLHGRAKVSSKGWVVIPKEIRDEMGIRPGDEVTMYLWPPPPDMKQDRGLYTLYVGRVPEDPVALGYGMFKRMPGEKPMTELLLEERRRELIEEERDLPPPASHKPA